MSPPLPPEIAAALDAAVRLGFEPNYELLERTRTLFLHHASYPGDDVLDQAFVDRVVAQMADQRTWARPTDAERLARAFDQLATKNIVARHYYGPTRDQAEATLLRESHGRAGYIFYSPQDAASLIDGTLDLAWGVPADAADGAADELAARLLSVLAEAGLTVHWNGELDAPIQLRRIDWKHPRDPDTLDTAIASRATPRLPHPITSDGKWRFRIAYLAAGRESGAFASLRHIHARTRSAAKLGTFDPFEDYSLAFNPADVEVEGRGIDLELRAPPSEPFIIHTQTEPIELADALVLVPGSEDMLEHLLHRVDVVRGGELPPIVITVDRWSSQRLAILDAQCPHGVVSADLESGQGVLEVLDTVVSRLAADLRRRLTSS